MSLLALAESMTLEKQALVIARWDYDENVFQSGLVVESVLVHHASRHADRVFHVSLKACLEFGVGQSGKFDTFAGFNMLVFALSLEFLFQLHRLWVFGHRLGVGM